MVVVIASPSDESAREQVAKSADQSVALLTPADLSRLGWRYSPDCTSAGTAVISGQTVPVRDIRGVLTRLPSVYENDLLAIDPQDRVYVAAEMTAFLLSWLFSLPCRVMNRPTATCLSGPYWRRERWIHEAALANIPVVPYGRTTHGDTSQECSLSLDSSSVVVTVIGDRCLGDVDRSLQSQARLLAKSAKVDLLSVHFTGPESGARFVSAHTWLDLGAPGVWDAILKHLCAPPGDT